MNHKLVETNSKKYLHFTSTSPLFQSEQAALDIITLCFEHDTTLVLVEGQTLSNDFVTLRTGIAGTALQKFGNYFIKAAVALTDKQEFPVRFQELISELNKGNTFRIFNNTNEALNWLLADLWCWPSRSVGGQE
ncbi:MAG: DUF4180 domain-containing protein [Limnochordia bacterium]